jgi:uncharacterized caspase-like protein
MTMSERRRALVIANSSYGPLGGLSELASPLHDAEELVRVLQDPVIGGFEVSTELNKDASTISRAIEEFFIFSEPKLDDLLLLYFSGHGLTDNDGCLYLCSGDTQMEGRRLRRSTAVASSFVDSIMRESRSRRQILILDCCHSGAFSDGHRGKGDPLPSLNDYFTSIQGKGRVVLTSSTSIQKSFEPVRPLERMEPSFYTKALVQGLETGDADRHGDGAIDVDELHEYLVEAIRDLSPHQTPTKSGYLEGNLYIARTTASARARLEKQIVSQKAQLDAEAKLLAQEKARLEEERKRLAAEQIEHLRLLQDGKERRAEKERQEKERQERERRERERQESSDSYSGWAD